MTLYHHQSRRRVWWRSLGSQAAWEWRIVTRALGSCTILPLVCAVVIVSGEILK